MNLKIKEIHSFRTVSFQKVVKRSDKLYLELYSFRTVSFQKVVKPAASGSIVIIEF